MSLALVQSMNLSDEEDLPEVRLACEKILKRIMKTTKSSGKSQMMIFDSLINQATEVYFHNPRKSAFLL